MPLATTTWAIPYANGSDAPCTGGDTIDAMADALDALLATFNFDLARVVTVPYASIQDTIPQTYTAPSNGFSSPQAIVNYDTVLADTQSLTNLATLPAVISLPSQRPGFWLVMADPGQFDPIGSTSDLMTTLIWSRDKSGSTSTVRRTGYATILNNIMAISTSGMLAVDATTGDLEVYTQVTSFVSSVQTATVQSSFFMAMWVADK